MKTKTRWIILSGVLVLLLITGILLMGRDVNVTVDGQSYLVNTHALTVGGVLRGMGIHLTNTDQVVPSANTWLRKGTAIQLNQSRPLVVWVDPTGTHVELQTAAKTPREALALLGFTAAAEDAFKLNGSPIGIDDPLPAGLGLVLQYIPAVEIRLSGLDKNETLKSPADTLGQALWLAGIHLKAGDTLSHSFTQSLTEALDVKVTRGTSLTISVDGKTIQTASAAKTVGAALAENGISLQNLDYSDPSEDSPIPQDGKITVVRVKLLVLDQQKVLPYTTEYTYDSTLANGTKEVTQTGQPGISNVRVLIRYENGTEVSRETETEVVLQTAVNEKVTSGTQATGTQSPATTAGGEGTIDTGSGVYSYYLSVPVHLTSYSPCRSGGSGCSNLTASGQQVVQGVLGVTSAWYKIFKGYQIYIPGYGIGSVEDIGGGIPGQYWIDLGYSDSDWVNWSKTITVYFLSPAPANFSGSLP
jgi:uncharacterized protein YabE (DUF348 family)/3D (Asp-Asp-Asp) domain-containing protein